MPAVLTAGAFALVVGAYWLVVLARRAKLRSTAAALGADYVNDAGWFAPGRIVGSRFSIRVAAVRRTFRTHVEVNIGRAPGSFLIQAGFFDGYPDWTFVKVRSPHQGQARGLALALPGYAAAPSSDECDRLWQWLTRGSKNRRLSADMLATVGIDALTIDDERVSVTFDGIVSQASRLKRTLDMLERLAAE